MKIEFSPARAGRLFAYDWTQERRRLLLVTAIIAGIYIFCALSTIGISSLSPIFDKTLPSRLWLTGQTVGDYATYAVIIYVTTLLHRKFTQPQSSCLYMTLPASALEKCVVMLTEYALAYAALWLMMAALYHLTTLVGMAVAPDYDWTMRSFFVDTQSIIDIVSNRMQSAQVTIETYGDGREAAAALLVDTIVDKITRYKGLFFAMDWATSIACLLYYILLNLHFRHNPQPKSIVIYLVTIVGFVLVGLMTFGLSIISDLQNYVAASDNTAWCVFVDNVGRTFSILFYFFLLMPVICVIECRLIYKKIRSQQAK